MRREKDWLTGRKCKSYSSNLKPCLTQQLFHAMPHIFMLSTSFLM